jgi:MoxR-like ATPase
LEQVIDREQLLEVQRTLEDVHVSESVGLYMIDLVIATRSHADVHVGASPRGALALLKASRGRALLKDRDYVTPDDVKAVAEPVLAHRLTLRPEMWVRRVRGNDVIHSILEQVPTPPAIESRSV